MSMSRGASSRQQLCKDSFLPTGAAGSREEAGSPSTGPKEPVWSASHILVFIYNLHRLVYPEGSGWLMSSGLPRGFKILLALFRKNTKESNLEFLYLLDHQVLKRRVGSLFLRSARGASRQRLGAVTHSILSSGPANTHLGLLHSG